MFSTDLLKSHDGRLGRWWSELADKNFTIEYRPGQENPVADFLSRYGYDDSAALDAKQLLPAHRFSSKALSDIESWFKKTPTTPNVREQLEKKIQNGSSLPVEKTLSPLPCSPSVSKPYSPDPQTCRKSFALRFAQNILTRGRHLAPLADLDDLLRVRTLCPAHDSQEQATFTAVCPEPTTAPEHSKYSPSTVENSPPPPTSPAIPVVSLAAPDPPPTSVAATYTPTSPDNEFVLPASGPRTKDTTVIAPAPSSNKWITLLVTMHELRNPPWVPTTILGYIQLYLALSLLVALPLSYAADGYEFVKIPNGTTIHYAVPTVLLSGALLYQIFKENYEDEGENRVRHHLKYYLNKVRPDLEYKNTPEENLNSVWKGTNLARSLTKEDTNGLLIKLFQAHSYLTRTQKDAQEREEALLADQQATDAINNDWYDIGKLFDEKNAEAPRYIRPLVEKTIRLSDLSPFLKFFPLPKETSDYDS
ncbi:retrotransposon [Fusarium langsethiae]|uniref:Retrotransposon n=1 Tax=Fusarium langsethiae TaxID=179993 RepID=A0A0N0DAX3_FUSLA|nr:retrotransposon [Fusarium langsethiae]